MSADVVCILNSSLEQVLATARPIKANVLEESQAMEHPLETGASVVDHRIILPTIIDLSMVLTGAEYKQAYQTARELFYSGEMLTVQTRTGSYPSMVITAMPHEETTDIADGTTLALSLTEVRYVEAQYSDAKVKNPNDARTVKRGEQQAGARTDTGTAARRGSILSGIFR